MSTVIKTLYHVKDFHRDDVSCVVWGVSVCGCRILPVVILSAGLQEIICLNNEESTRNKTPKKKPQPNTPYTSN